MTLDYNFSADELADMRETQEDHMMDSGSVELITIVPDTFGQEVESWAAGTEIACGLDMRPGSERHGTEKTIVEYDAVIRLPIGTAIDLRDKVKITKRFGETLATPILYEIVGPIQQGASGIRVLLQRTEV